MAHYSTLFLAHSLDKCRRTPQSRADARTRAAVSFLMIASVAGCGTLKTYEEPERPDAEVAILEGYFRYYLLFLSQATISRIDDKAVSTSSIKFLPGHHRIEFERFGALVGIGGGLGGTRTCAFESDFQAGHLYKLKPHSDKIGSTTIEVSAPGLASRAADIAIECTQGTGSPSPSR